MDLVKITGLLVVCLISSFVIRTVGTLYPEIFQNMLLLKTITVIYLVFVITQALFYLFFYNQYARDRAPLLRWASIGAFCGTGLVAMLHIKMLLQAYHLHPIPEYLNNHYFELLIPFAGNIGNVIFLIIFKKVQSEHERQELNRPIISAIAGDMIFFLLRVILLACFLAIHEFHWLEYVPRQITVGTTPATVLAAALVLYFYFKFYGFIRDQDNWEPKGPMPVM